MQIPQSRRLRRDLALTVLPLVLGIAVAVAGQQMASLTGLSFLAIVGLMSGMGLCALGTARLARRLLLPDVDAAELFRAARQLDPGRAWQGLCLVLASLVLGLCSLARAEAPPAASLPLLPILAAEQARLWPDMPDRPALAAQVEQETCPSLRHRMCWSPRAELRTPREQGVGLAQITRTWRADGSPRFDSLAELRAQFVTELASWRWDAPALYDPQLQLRALVLMDHRNWLAIAGAPVPHERLAMTLASYNGGLGGLAADRALCGATAGCDPARWYGHVERTCTKALTAQPGYGRSFCEINREYPAAIQGPRRARYVQALEA